MRTTPTRVTVPASWLALLLGTALGLLSFAASAALWRAGHPRVAGAAAEAVLLLSLATVAAVTLGAQPTRMRRARVPVGRPVPLAWWPVQHDPLPVLAACVGTPIAAGAGAAALLFR